MTLGCEARRSSGVRTQRRMAGRENFSRKRSVLRTNDACYEKDKERRRGVNKAECQKKRQRDGRCRGKNKER